MKKNIILSVLFIFISGFAFSAHAGLDDFLKQINAKAIKDITNFNARLSEHFRIPIPRIEGILKAVVKPADAFMLPCERPPLMSNEIRTPIILQEKYLSYQLNPIYIPKSITKPQYYYYPHPSITNTDCAKPTPALGLHDFKVANFLFLAYLINRSVSISCCDSLGL